MNYDTIKALAKTRKCRVPDLIALAPQNDPFYVGTPADQVNARWFADLWQRFGYRHGVHIRRAHYQIISQSDPILLPNGKPYENTESYWDFLNVATKAARYLELVDPGAFVDRRNPPALSYVPESSGAPPLLRVSNDIYSEASSLPEFPELPDYGLGGYEGCQAYHIELWAEKSTINDVLIPLCERYGAVLQTGLGERSIAVARKIEYVLHTRALDLDIRLLPVCLTEPQVRDYQLRRAANFEARYGAGAVELDALEALYPGALRKVLSDAVERYFDNSLKRRV